MSVVVLDIETQGCQPWERKDWLVSVGIGLNAHRPERGRMLARMLMAKPGTTIVAHTNYDCRLLLLDGATLADGVNFHDTRVMAWMLDGTQALDLETLAQKYLGYTPPKHIRMRKGVVHFACADGSVVPITEAPWEEVAAYNQSDCRTEGELYEVLREELRERDLWDYFLEEEAPFSRLLVEMEATGVPFDRERATLMLIDTTAVLEARKAWLVAQTGAPGFNLASGDQVADFIYSEGWTHKVKFEIPRLNGMTPEAKLEAVSKMAPEGTAVTKVGRDYAYGVMELEGLALAPPRGKKWEHKKRPTVSGKILNIKYGAHPWVAAYIEFQKVVKLAGYMRDWLEREHGGMLHGRFNQAGTITGRLSAKEPNMQQISHASEVRDIFRGDLVVGDYAGLEARLAAHFSHDPVMLDIFREGKDLYGTLAANAWGGPQTKENEGRGLMKVLMLASQYGAQGETLAQTMAIAGLRGYSARKADALLRDLEATMPRLFEWRQEVIEEARTMGFVTTLAGRRRKLPDLESAEWRKMAKAERQAVNSKVQGSAADVVRRAMLKARDLIDPEEARICLQVHDEILWKRGAAWKPEVFPKLVLICETAHGFKLDVPLVFEAQVAQSWAAKGGSAGGVESGAYADLGDALEQAAA